MGKQMQRMRAYVRRGPRLRARGRRQDERGQSLVEFGLIVVIVGLMLVGAIDYARLFYTQTAVANASRLGAEWLIDPSHCADMDYTRSLIRSEASPNVSFTNITLPSTPCTATNQFTVTVRTNFTFMAPMMPAVLGKTNPMSVTNSTTAKFRN